MTYNKPVNCCLFIINHNVLTRYVRKLIKVSKDREDLSTTMTSAYLAHSKFVLINLALLVF